MAPPLRATSQIACVTTYTWPSSSAKASLSQILGRAYSSHGTSYTSLSRLSLLQTCSKRAARQVHAATTALRRDPQRRNLTTATTIKPTPVALVNDLPRGFQEVVVDFHDGKATRYPSFWLRDHCRCSDCTHPQTRQRQIDTFSLDPDIKAVEAEPTAEGLKVSWTNSEHVSLYPWSWLQKHTPFTPLPSTYNPRGKWQHVSPASPKYPTVDHDLVMGSDSGLSTLLSQIRKYGFSFIANTPPTPEATEKLCERIAHIRQTHYGGFWEVISKSDPIDTAYTNLFLPNHTDNTYFTEPCGLQLFHCLSHTPPPSDSKSTSTNSISLGGESTLVDGFSAAQHLHQTDPQSYKLFSQVPITSHASGSPNIGPLMNNTLSSPGNPVFSHLLPNSPPNPKNLSCIRWNNADRHSSTSWPSHQTMISWYEAARKWDAILKDPRFEIVVKLGPGMPVVFDNWRVLHGRRAFVGERRVCGAYVGMDDFIARGKSLGWRMEGEGEGEGEGEEEGVD